MFDLAERLYPICRSITGDGVRRSLEIIKQLIPLKTKEIESGTRVFDWIVPDEWNITDAWLKDPQGKTIVDFKNHNLHILNYSEPFRGKVSLQELKSHLYTLPDQPELIPYRTSYYEKKWGFCMAHKQYEELEDGEYEVMIDSTLRPGSLTTGELYIPGRSKDEILFSTHTCHPSLANDNVSGMTVLTYLADHLLKQPQQRYSYRFIFIPGTIGSITWLALNESELGNIKGGLVASLLGDAGPFHYKKSRQGDELIDQIVPLVLSESEEAHQILDFIPYGYDERQYCSPGINLAMGCLTRSTFGSFPEYHTSADDLKFIAAGHLQQSLSIYLRVVNVFENNLKLINVNPKCEPQLGRRGLYAAIGGESNKNEWQMAMLWLLNLSDGRHSTLDIAKRSTLPFELLARASQVLMTHGLLVDPSID